MYVCYRLIELCDSDQEVAIHSAHVVHSAENHLKANRCNPNCGSYMYFISRLAALMITFHHM